MVTLSEVRKFYPLLRTRKLRLGGEVSNLSKVTKLGSDRLEFKSQDL